MEKNNAYFVMFFADRDGSERRRLEVQLSDMQTELTNSKQKVQVLARTRYVR